MENPIPNANLQEIPIKSSLLTFNDASLTGNVSDGGFNLNGVPAFLLFAIVVLYFVIFTRYLGGAVWQPCRVGKGAHRAPCPRDPLPSKLTNRCGIWKRWARFALPTLRLLPHAIRDCHAPLCPMAVCRTGEACVFGRRY